jgi:glutamyl-Q tRNA(Asp) synthetase
VASFLDARAHGGEWLVRIEDLDPPREVPSAADEILRTLEALGLEWDGEIMYQSHRSEAYREALERLRNTGECYPCSCTRREVTEAGLPGLSGPVYPGTCRGRLSAPGRPHAYRALTHGAHVGFTDRIRGALDQDLEREVGDFVIRRSDGLYAYQLAVVVDDAYQGITHVVRGADLLTSTPRQIHLQQLCGYAQPSYAHLPLVLDADGRKLSKQARALPVDRRRPLQALRAALTFLGQTPPPPELGDLEDFWIWATTHWSPKRVPTRDARFSRPH